MNSHVWKQFERIIAAIHIAKTRGAKVTWNEDIDGRQFDVAVRFHDGLYDYLTLIECKRYASPVPVEKVEAFVTKSRAAKANKAIVISSSGFQSGCVKVAKDNNISIMTVSEAWELPGHSSEWEIRQTLIVFDVHVHKQNGGAFLLPDVNGRLQYFFNHSTLTYGNGRKQSLHDLAAPFLSRLHFPAEPVVHKIPLRDCRITVPYELQDEEITGISFRVEQRPMPFYKGPSLDPSKLEKLMHRYQLCDEIAGTTVTIEALGLPLGFDTQLTPGKFYTNPNLGNNYAIEKVEHGKAQIFLLESYVHGHLLQARYIQDLKYQDQYVEVVEESELARLKRMYEREKH